MALVNAHKDGGGALLELSAPPANTYSGQSAGRFIFLSNAL